MAPLSQRIIKEKQQLIENPLEGFIIAPDNSNERKLAAIFTGLSGTRDENSVYFILIEIPEKYPLEPPSVRFLNNPRKPSVDDHGFFKMKILKSVWTPAVGIGWILNFVRLLMCDNPTSGQYVSSALVFLRLMNNPNDINDIVPLHVFIRNPQQSQLEA